MRGVLGIFFPLKGVLGSKMFENPCPRAYFHCGPGGKEDRASGNKSSNKEAFI